MGFVSSSIDYTLAEITKDPTGFRDNSLITETYDPTTRKITITSSSGIIEIVQNRKVYSFASPIVSDAHANTVGAATFYLKFADGAFTWSNTLWAFYEVQVAIVVWDSANTPQGFFLKECHNTMPWSCHDEFHFGLGTLFKSGATLSDYTLKTNTDAALTYSIAQTIIKDEDLPHTLAALADGGPYTIFQRTGTSGRWSWSITEAVPFLRTGAAAPAQRNYDAGGGTGWTVEDATPNGQRVNYYILAVPNGNAGSFRFIHIPGQTFYSTLSAATAESFNSLSLGTLLDSLPEFFLFAQVTYNRVANAAVIEQVTSLRGNRFSVIGSTAAPTVHNSLSGRTALAQHPTTAIYGATQDRVIVTQNDGGGGVNLIETSTTTAELNSLNTVAGKAFYIMSFDSTGAPRYDGTDAVRMATGTTAQRPTGAAGMVRFNSELGVFESYRGTFWAQNGGQWATGNLAAGGTTVFTPPTISGATCTGYDLLLKIDNGTNNEMLKINGNLSNTTWIGTISSVGGTDLATTIAIADATGAVTITGINGTYKYRVEGFIF